MKLSTDWHDFRAKLDKNYPRKASQRLINADKLFNLLEQSGRRIVTGATCRSVVLPP